MNKNKHILSVNPFMPKGWKRINCSLLWQDKLLRFNVENDKVSVKIDAKMNVKLKINVFGVLYTINNKKKATFCRKKTDDRGKAYYL